MAEAPLSSLALYTARPTVRVNGTEKERVNGLLTAIEMTEHEDGLSTLEMKVDNVATDAAGNADFAFEDEASFKLGDTITVYCGEGTAPTEIFRGVISALEAEFPDDGSPTLTALAEDTLQKARFKRRTNWERTEVVTRDMWEVLLDALERRYRRREGVSDEDIAGVRKVLAGLPDEDDSPKRHEGVTKGHEEDTT